MQVKTEICAGDNLCNEQVMNSLPSLSSHNNQFSLQDMTCFSNGIDKSSPYSLWAEYFDNFPVLTEFDLRSTVNCAGSTGSSIASSASTSCESWSSPGSGSPFSDCDTDESPFDDNSVPNSVIDEIVQTLKMDGYNFDHLGEDIIDIASNQIAIKQEPELTNQACILQSPVYTSLHPPKLQLMETRKYNSQNLNDNISSINNNPLQSNLYDSSSDGKWSHQANLNNHNSNNNNIPGSLPSMSLPLLQIQQHNPHIQQQQHHHQVNHLQQPDMNHTHHQNHPQVHHLQQMNYTNSILDGCNSSPQYTNAVFPESFSLHSPPIIDTYKYLNCKSPVMSQPPQLAQACEKQIETKPRRRRSTNSINKVEKPHVCKECGAAFKLSANLKQHQVIHTGEKPFSCEICKAMFTRLSSLKTHHRLHTGEKPHICPFCSAAFADRSAMKAHKRIHTGERPYKCQVCSTSFTQLSHLNAHKRTHTGEKPYACSVCSTTFKQLGHLKRHEKSHVCSGRC